MLVEEVGVLLKANGYRLMLSQDARTWTATALSRDLKRNPSGVAMYMQYIASGDTAEEALSGLKEEVVGAKLLEANEDLF